MISHKREWWLLALIVAVGALLRFYNLATLPSGLHGDEAVSGIEAQRILREGSIGPYSPMALGQPTGPLYFITFPVRIWDNSVFAVRFWSALISTLTIPLLYFVLRRQFGVAVALAGAATLAAMSWHIHFSRIGFPLVTWPFFVVLTAGAVAEAVRREKIWWWALAGGIAGLGVYIYNAHHLFFGIVWLYVWLYVLTVRHVNIRARFAGLAIFTVTALVAAIPMLRYALNPANGYTHHFQQFSVFHQKEWAALHGPGQQLLYLLKRYITFWDRVAWHPQLDGGDGTGTIPLVPFSLLLFVLIGVVLALRHHRSALTYLGLLAVFLMPLSAVVTIDGLARRSFAIVPFMAMFAAIGMVHLARKANSLHFRLRVPALAVLALWLVGAAWQNIGGYFLHFGRSQEQRWVFSDELVEAIKWMKSLSPEYHFYFASSRWSHLYQTREFLAPGISVEDRSKEFGRLDWKVEAGRDKVAFVLIDNYKSSLSQLQQLYPGGTVVTGRVINPDAGAEVPPDHYTRQPAFIGYILPEKPVQTR